MTRDYWFARRFPLASPRSAYAPVHWKGWLMSILFVLALGVGGVAFVWFGLQDQMVEGIAVFVIISFVATAWFLLVVRANSDPVRTVAEHRGDRARV